MQDVAATEDGRLLRVLFLRISQVSARANAADVFNLQCMRVISHAGAI